jgi:chaperonin cofactor prefoldin
VADLFSQETSLLILENEFARIDSSISKLDFQRVQLSKQIQSNANAIQELKDKDKLNYFQRQRLERLLKDSQDLSNQIERIDSQIRSLNKLYKKTGNQLIGLYDSEIKNSLNEIARKKSSPNSRQTLHQKVENLRSKREQVKQKIGAVAVSPIKIPKLQIEPDDTPKQIEQKADLLKDQEDKLQRLAKQIELQTTELQKELEIRNRMDELVTDLALFDQQEEALSNVSTFNEQARAFNEEISIGEVGENQFLEENLLVGQKDFDFSNLTTERLEEAIEHLKNQQQHIQAQADSLADQAESFYQAAQEMKKP